VTFPPSYFLLPVKKARTDLKISLIELDEERILTHSRNGNSGIERIKCIDSLDEKSAAHSELK
jgi:hypothetical protein